MDEQLELNLLDRAFLNLNLDVYFPVHSACMVCVEIVTYPHEAVQDLLSTGHN
jgi:hypothetical protein